MGYDVDNISLQHLRYEDGDGAVTNVLKPFDKVLVRNATYEKWQPHLFSHFNGGFYYVIGGKNFSQCIAYTAQDLTAQHNT